jgi:AraC-like DNA-binding protein
MALIQFTAPPMPHYIVSGEDTYSIGSSHAARSKIGVFDLIIVTQGTLFLMEEEEELEVKAGQYLLLLPDRAHRTYRACSEQTHFYWVHFQTLGSWGVASEQRGFIQLNEGENYARIEQFTFFLPQCNRLYSYEESYELIQQLNILRDQPLNTDRWKQQVLFQELLLKLAEGKRNLQMTPHILVAEQAASFLRQNYRNPVSYAELAEAVHFHPNYVALCMKRVFGVTPLEFVTRYRIEQAKLLLIHTNDQIGIIAEDSGFGSFPFFIRCFTKHTGFRPKAFRMKYRV